MNEKNKNKNQQKKGQPYTTPTIKEKIYSINRSKILKKKLKIPSIISIV